MSEDRQNQLANYIDGRMSSRERESLEKALAEDPGLAQEVADLKALDHGLYAMGMDRFMDDLKSWEQDLAVPQPSMANWKNFLAVAAVTTLIVVPAIYLFTSNKPTSEELFLSYYEPYEEMIISRGNATDSINSLLVKGMEAYNLGAYLECSNLLQSYLQHQTDARVSLYLAIAQLELDQQQSAEANFLLAQKDPVFKQQAQWYQALSYLKFSEIEKAKNVLGLIVDQKNHYRNSEAGRLLKELG